MRTLTHPKRVVFVGFCSSRTDLTSARTCFWPVFSGAKPSPCLPSLTTDACIHCFIRSSDYVTTNLTKLNIILSIQKKKQLKTQGKEQLPGKNGPWILIPGLLSGIDLGQLIYSLPWRLFLESQGLKKKQTWDSESEMTCLDSQSECSSQAKLESTRPYSPARGCAYCSWRFLVFSFAVSLPLCMNSQPLLFLGWFTAWYTWL